jgi:hypothetical protein
MERVRPKSYSCLEKKLDRLLSSIRKNAEEVLMSTILLVILVLLLLGALPSWPYSRSWGYYPSSGLGLVVVVLLVLVLAGRI